MRKRSVRGTFGTSLAIPISSFASGIDEETLRRAGVSRRGDPMQRRASAQWRGGLKDGKGTVSTASGALKTVAYGFAMRFENAPGTNPEELVAAAHASCFAIAFPSELGKAGFRPDLVEVKGRLGLEKTDVGWWVNSIQL